jgi:antitoxin (DNA-binding transcriptional repressor) of toxin-antitoxin stability system
MVAKTASVAQLKAKLSAYLDTVKAGEEVIVTERGHAIARWCRSRAVGLRPRGTRRWCAPG